MPRHFINYKQQTKHKTVPIVPPRQQTQFLSCISLGEQVFGIIAVRNDGI